MELYLYIIIALAIIFGLYMAWGIGANDVANAMGTSVGSGALTLRRAVIIAAILEFSGAFLAGSHVSETVRKGIVDPSIFAGDGLSFMLGMLSALLAAGVWLQIASWKGWPVSTTHSIVGSVVGFGAVYGGINAVHWDKVSMIAASWVVSPLLSATISYFIFTFILRAVFYDARPLRSAKKIAPYLVFVVITMLSLTMAFKGLKNLKLDLSLPAAFAAASVVGLIAAIISVWLISRIKSQDDSGVDEDRLTDPNIVKSLEKAAKHLEKVHSNAPGHMKSEVSDTLDEVRRLRWESQRHYDFHTNSAEYQQVEKLFVYLQILSACFVAFAHGANDVANAIGPMSAVLSVALAGGESIAAKAPVPLWVLALGGAGIIVGLATWGWRVMETIGRKITHLTPTRGFSAEFGAATTIVIATKMGLPISTTHTLVGAVLGVGLARGIGAVNMGTIRDVVVSWVITIPAGAVLAITFFYGLRLFF
jgi:inorganic phosphate transporter, PiT family